MEIFGFVSVFSFHPQHRHPPPVIVLPRTAWVRFNLLRTGDRRFRPCLHEWDMAPSAVCERSTKKQVVCHVVLRCPIQQPPHELHGLAVLRRQSTGCSTPDPRCRAAKQWIRTRSNDEDNQWTLLGCYISHTTWYSTIPSQWQRSTLNNTSATTERKACCQTVVSVADFVNWCPHNHLLIAYLWLEFLGMTSSDLK